MPPSNELSKSTCCQRYRFGLHRRRNQEMDNSCPAGLSGRALASLSDQLKSCASRWQQGFSNGQVRTKPAVQGKNHLLSQASVALTLGLMN